MSRVQVLLVDPSGQLYGSEKVLLDLLAHLDRDQLEVVVACPHDQPLWRELRGRGENIVAIDTQGAGLLGKSRSVLSLRRAILQVNPDVIHLNQAGPFKHVALANLGRRTPLLVHVRLAEDAHHVQSGLSKVLSPTMVVAISEYIRSILGSAIPAATLYDAFDAAAWRASAAASPRAALHTQLDLPGDTRLGLFVGRICEVKGVDVLIRALAHLDDVPSFHLVVVGGAATGSVHERYEADLREQARALGVGKRVTFIGPRADVPALVREANVLIAPSRVEPLGRVLFESLALGVPIVASATGGMREVVGDDERGLSAPAGDPVALAQCIRKTLGDPEAARGRTEVGAKWVDENCDPAAHAARMMEIYFDLVRQAPPAQSRTQVAPLKSTP